MIGLKSRDSRHHDLRANRSRKVSPLTRRSRWRLSFALEVAADASRSLPRAASCVIPGSKRSWHRAKTLDIDMAQEAQQVGPPPSRVMATDLDTEHGGTDANKRDGARQVGRLNVAGLQL